MTSRFFKKRKKDSLPLDTEVLDWKHQFPEIEKRESPLLRSWITRIPLLRCLIRRKTMGTRVIDWNNPFPIGVSVCYRHRHSSPTLKEKFSELDVGVFSYNSYKARTCTFERIHGSKRNGAEDIRFSFSLTNNGSPVGLSVRSHQRRKPDVGNEGEEILRRIAKERMSNFEVEGIRERIFDVKKESELVMKLFPEVDDVMGYESAYAVYVSNDDIHPIFGDLSTKRADEWRPRTGFQAHLKKHQPKCLTDLVFLIDSYHLGVNRPEYSLDSGLFRDMGVVDDILKDSKGTLLWHYQLDHLFGCFYQDWNRVIELRKDINRKKTEVFDLAEKLKFAQGTTLNDVIRERMIFSVTSPPNFRGALVLFQHLAINHLNSKRR